MLGIIPAAGVGSRLQPLAFSKEMLPVGSRRDADGVERPKAVSEFLVDRMLRAGADRICFVISPAKTDIIPYFARHAAAERFCYVVQRHPRGLCDAIFQARTVMRGDEDVLVGLPDTVWYPEDGFCRLPRARLAFLAFPVACPQHFDVLLTDGDAVREIQVKPSAPGSHWVWGAFGLPAAVLEALHALWCEPERGDEYVGTLVNAWLARGGAACAVFAGEDYHDIGTLDGYRAAVASLAGRATLAA